MAFTYDGSSFYGWQRQKNASPTLQAEIEGVLSRICSSRVSVTASGRTDAGVHARIQVAHADIPAAKKEVGKRFKFERLLLGINALLPPSVRMLSIEEVPFHFHAQKNVERKTYLYFLATMPVCPPFLVKNMWHLRFPLDWRRMEKAAAMLEGAHYFKAFCDANSSAKTFDRTVFESELSREISIESFPWWGSGIDFTHQTGYRVYRVTGSGFLKHMVRCIVGTLVAIGQGRRTLVDLQRALETGERKYVGPTAPAHGLWLWDIRYRS